jgi:DNA-binding NarL/FixJ family response regulator
MPRHTVLLVDDHLVFTRDVVRLLSERFEIFGAITDVSAVVEIAATLRPDVIVLNTSMPGMRGLEALGRVVAAHAHPRVILVTTDADPRRALDAMQLGAQGFVLKHSSTGELAGAIEAVLAGQRYLPPPLAERVVALMSSAAEWRDTKPLTSNQREILRLLIDGLPLQEIAEHLQLSPRTVETLKHDMMRDLGIQSTPELVKYALEHNLVPV